MTRKNHSIKTRRLLRLPAAGLLILMFLGEYSLFSPGLGIFFPKTPVMAQGAFGEEEEDEDAFGGANSAFGDADSEDDFGAGGFGGDDFASTDETDEEDENFGGKIAPRTAPAAKPSPRGGSDLFGSSDGIRIPPGDRQFGDAGVEAILATNPKTAQELVRCGKLIAGLRRMEIAKSLFKKAVAAKPTDAEIYEMVMEHGQRFFATLAKDPRYAPEGTALGEMVLQSMDRRFEDEAVIKAVIKRLWDADMTARRQAKTELQGKSSVSLPVLLASLTDPQMKNGRAEIEAMLLTFGEKTTSAISAVLDSENAALKIACIRVLAMQAAQQNRQAAGNLFLAAAGQDKESEAVRKSAYDTLGSLLQKDFSKPSARRMVDEAIMAELLRLSQQLNRMRAEEKTDISTVLVWRWDEETKRPVPSVKSSEEALSLNCYRFAKALWKTRPESPLAKREYLKNTLEQTIFTRGIQSEKLLQTPEFKEIMKHFSPADVETLLIFCLHEKAYTAAFGAAVILGEIGNEGFLVPREFRNVSAEKKSMTLALSPIVIALNTPSRNVRFAAMEAIMKWDPKKPYSGSQLFIDNLAWFLSTSGKPRVLVTGGGSTDAGILGGRFLSFGYYADAADSGREAIIKCQHSSDFVFLLISMETRNPSPDFLVQSIRQDAKMADIPIIFVARSEDFREAERLSEKTSRSVWIPRPSCEADVELTLKLVARLQGFSPATDLQRLEETRKCLLWTEKIVAAHRGGWMQKISPTAVKYAAGTEISENTPPPARDIYDISKLQTPVMNLTAISAYTSEVAAVLAWLGTPASQVMLANFASSGTQDFDLRKKCVLALLTSVDHFGILMSGPEVAKQYDIYNGTSPRDKESRIIRDAILTVLERPLAKK